MAAVKGQAFGKGLNDKKGGGISFNVKKKGWKPG